MKTAGPEPDPHEIRAILRAMARQRAAFSDDTATFFLGVDLTMGQFRTLIAVRHWGRQSGRGLARRLHVTPGTLVPMIDRLEELGYLRRVPDQDDRRTTWLELTPRADALFQRMWGAGAARLTTAIGKLIPRDRAELARLLDQLATNLEDSRARRLSESAHSQAVPATH